MILSPRSRSQLDLQKQDLRNSYRKRIERKVGKQRQIHNIDDNYLSLLGKHGKVIEKLRDFQHAKHSSIVQ